MSFWSVQWVAFLTISRKEIRRFMRIWQQTLLPPAVTMVLYFAIFGTLIGGRIGDMGGVSYMAFIVPGLIVMSVISNAYNNVASSFFSNKFQQSIEELMVAPLEPVTILLGYVVGSVIRGLMVGGIVTLLSLLFTDLHVHSLWVVFTVVLLTAVLFALGGLINAIYARNFDDISIIPHFVILPLTYLGGVFYSIDLLPPFWQWVSQINPILYMVNAFRYGMLGISDVSLWVSFGVILLFILAFFVYALWLLKRGKGLRL